MTSAFRPTRSPKTSLLVAQALAAMMFDGGLTEGRRLPPEKDMLAQFGVARATLREALRLLEVQGLLFIKSGPGGGPIITRPGVDSLAQYLATAFSAHGATLEDLIKARKHFEPSVARASAENATAEDIAELWESVHRMRATVDREGDFLQENRRFHELVAKSSRNPIFLIVVSSLGVINDGSMVGVSYGEKNRVAVVDAHQRVVEAIEKRDADAAESEMTHHVDEFEQYARSRYSNLLEQRVHPVLPNTAGSTVSLEIDSAAV